MHLGKYGKNSVVNKNQIKSLSETYRDKKVFVTGHTGFKGAWLGSWLKLLGATVRGYSLPPQTTPSLFTELKLGNECESIFGDIRQEEKLRKAILDFKPDFVFHLAAQPLVRESYKDPLGTYETNVLGTANLLHILRNLEKCTCLLITTDKVYENREWHYPYRENDRLGGYDPYSSSKACCEILIDSFRNSFFNGDDFENHQISLASARAGNVIGGGDWSEDRIVPDIVLSLRKEKTILLRNPHAIRPWQHVLEPLGGYLLLASRLNSEPSKHSMPWNFGPKMEDNISVENLVQKAINIWGSGEFKVLREANQPHEAGLLKLDISQAVNQIDWKPKWNCDVAIEKSINWYKCFDMDEDAKSLIYSDIEAYCK
ncbi:MAG: CDP-glucose 4,6-dehydratase [Cyclobacteriaceae bacterium]